MSKFETVDVWYGTKTEKYRCYHKHTVPSFHVYPTLIKKLPILLRSSLQNQLPGWISEAIRQKINF